MPEKTTTIAAIEALEKAKEDLRHVIMTDHVGSAFRSIDNALSLLRSPSAEGAGEFQLPQGDNRRVKTWFKERKPAGTIHVCIPIEEPEGAPDPMDYRMSDEEIERIRQETPHPIGNPVDPFKFGLSAGLHLARRRYDENRLAPAPSVDKEEIEPASEPVAWCVAYDGSGPNKGRRVHSDPTMHKEEAEALALRSGLELVPLYAAPQPTPALIKAGEAMRNYLKALAAGWDADEGGDSFEPHCLFDAWDAAKAQLKP